MKLLLIYIGLLLSVAVTEANVKSKTKTSNEAGILNVGMNVSVTVLEPSQITDVQPMVSGIPSRGSKKLYNESPGVGSVSFVSSPQKELLISISGNKSLIDGNGGSITFSPEVLIGSNVKSSHILSSGGAAVSVIYTGSGYGDLNASPVETGSNGETVIADVQFDEPGSKTIRATSIDLLSDTSSVKTVLTDEEVSGFSIVAPDSSAIDTVIAGLPFDIKIAAINGGGNLIDTFNDMVVISSSSAISDGGGETGEFTDGIFELHSVTLTGSGEHTMTAQLPEDASFSGTTDPFVVLPGGVHFPNGVVTSAPAEV